MIYLEDKKQFPPPSHFSTQAPIKEEDLGEASHEEADIDVVGAEQVKNDSNIVLKYFFLLLIERIHQLIL